MLTSVEKGDWQTRGRIEKSARKHGQPSRLRSGAPEGIPGWEV